MRFLRCLLLAPLLTALPAQEISNTPWKFAVSGDSRNCGDVVMPAIASGVQRSGADFYWHLGDFRAIYTFDEDLAPPARLGLPARPMTISSYHSSAWPDFIAKQLTPFGNLPVFLGIGNHEAIPPMTRDAWLIQFADWVDKPVIRAQRLKDDPQDHKLHGYYHWISHNVDFINLDNATPDQFDAAQLGWLRAVLERDQASEEIRTIVAGMHEALPGSVSRSHSMSESAQGDKSGREAYQLLWNAQNSGHKRVYVLASHSHFYMENIFDTPDWKRRVLPGWIAGTAGAVRYRLPSETGPSQKAMTDVYGFLLATVASGGAISFQFQKLSLDDLMAASTGRNSEALVRWCYEQNKNLTPLP
ncbi:MAG TPA: hypothetical protein VEV17_08455 [Bryobacteraceae bacterium]|nr:hypothetical protein [Bryobacteraceae bacterium]